MTNPNNDVLYTGVTSDLLSRVYQHKQKLADGFTKRYNATKFVYYEIFDTIADAIVREKQIKGGSRKKKIDLIMVRNPSWWDLGSEL